MASFLLIFIIPLVFVAEMSRAAEVDNHTLRISGRAEFKLKYARGDATPLAGTGHSLGRPDLVQLLALNVRGQITPGLSISADLDNQRGGNLQMLRLQLEGEKIKGRFGGLSVKSRNPYTSYSERLRGVEMTALFSKVELGIVAGRVQGVTAKRTFRGSSAEEEILYEANAPYGPSPTTQGFRACLDGMQYYVLTTAFDPDFMEVWLHYDDQADAGGRTLAETLQLWNLDYLLVEAGDRIPLAPGQFVSVSSTEELLALRVNIADILRGQIRSLIRAFNAHWGLIGEEEKRYPFVHGSEAEGTFLQDLLTRHIKIVAGVEDELGLTALDAKANSYLQKSLYDLGQTNVKPGSLEVEVRKGSNFLAVGVELPLLFQVDYELGIIEFDLPPDFFATYDAIKIRYDYEITLGVFNLGLGIVEGSERIFLNDVLLAKTSDYSLDYELGILSVFRTLDAEDVLRVEYEYFRGPFGQMADYKTNYYGAELGWMPNENLLLNLELASYADQTRSAVAPESISTMPNKHTVIGLSGTYQQKGLTISGDVAFSHNQFPFDDNRKGKAPNKISAIIGPKDADGKDYVIFAHNDGISAGRGGFCSYRLDAGLSSVTVRGMASADEVWFFATDNGLTILSAMPGPALPNPFDYASNWERMYTSAGLPSNDLTCVTTTPWAVWVGTADSGLASADLSALDVWTAYAGQLPSLAISSVAYDPLTDSVLAGTDRGIATLTGAQFTAELTAVPINMVYSSFAAINGFNSFAASESGVYARRSDGTWQLLPATPQNSQCLAVWQQLLWVGTGAGLYYWDGTTWELIEQTGRYSITALGAGPGYAHRNTETLWVGTAGTALQEAEAGSEIICFELLNPLTVEKHAGEELAVASSDSHRYVDLSSEDHTATGYAARINARYASEKASVYASYETVAPGFMRITQAARQVADVWRLGTQLAPSPKVSIIAEHSRTATSGSYADLAEKGEVVTVSNRVGGTVNFGPQVDFSLGLTSTSGRQIADVVRKGRVFSAVGRHSLLGNRLHLSAGYERNMEENLLRPENSFHQTTLRGEAWLTLETFSLTGSYKRPVKTINPAGEQQRITGITETRLRAQWNKQLGTVNLRANYGQTSRSNIATKKAFANKRAEIKATLPPLPIKDRELIPTVVLKWDHTLPFSGQANRSLTAQSSILGNLANLKTTTGLVFKRTEYAGIGKLVADIEFFTSFNTTTQQTVQTQADLRWKRSKSARPDLGTICIDSFTGTARLTWSPCQKISNTISAAYTLSLSSAPKNRQKQTLNLQNSLYYRLSDKCTLTGAALARLAAAEQAGPQVRHSVRLSLTGGFSYLFSETWSLSTSFGYHHNSTPAASKRQTNAFTIEAGLKATF